MVDREIIREWLAKADEDFGFASSVSEFSDYYGQICFHYQQAAEKYLKAFIIAKDLEFKKIHDLSELLKLGVCEEPALSGIEEDCLFLNRFYIDTRYPVHWPVNYTKEVVSAAKNAASNISRMVRKLLGENRGSGF